jgi:triosephosphate isomerase
LEERESNRTEAVLETQLIGSLANIGGDALAPVVVAYEPVWAIGTGRNATPQQAQDAHAFVRSWIAKICGDSAAKNVLIQYGGSVKPDNAATLLSQPDVDGALVGGASLEPDEFARIVRYREG